MPHKKHYVLQQLVPPKCATQLLLITALLPVTPKKYPALLRGMYYKK